MCRRQSLWFLDIVPNYLHTGNFGNFIVEMNLSRYHAIASEMWLESTYCEYFILKRNMLHYFHLIHACPSMVVQATFTGLVCTSMVNYQVTGYVAVTCNTGSKNLHIEELSNALFLPNFYRVSSIIQLKKCAIACKCRQSSSRL